LPVKATQLSIATDSQPGCSIICQTQKSHPGKLHRFIDPLSMLRKQAQAA
jgi:hypothetical protein